MNSYSPLFLLTFILLLPLHYSLAEKSTDEVRTQVRVLIDETRESPDWVYIGETKHSYVGFLSKDHFKVNGPERRAWTKVFVRDGDSVKTKYSEERTLIYLLTHRIYDCSLKRISDIKSVNYYTDGTNESIDYTAFYKSYPDKRWTEIVPGSIGDVLLKFVCGYDPA
jgi:surface-adhesin protein E